MLAPKRDRLFCPNARGIYTKPNGCPLTVEKLGEPPMLHLPAFDPLRHEECRASAGAQSMRRGDVGIEKETAWRLLNRHGGC
ncbi:hypothetical protein Thiosp_03222 [Thiorhodovibrio litoralis]|nr:hypothetical protein Thiosp_03222 [Thiorhodovibrio litoralis]